LVEKIGPCVYRKPHLAMISVLAVSVTDVMNTCVAGCSNGPQMFPNGAENGCFSWGANLIFWET
jgi:hypothetical protein